jgi:hypothetical protein
MLHKKVAHSNRSNLPLRVKLFHDLPGGLSLRDRVVHEVEVHVVGPEFREALVESALNVAVLIVPYFSRDKDLIARDLLGGHPIADFLLVCVEGGRVDVAVASVPSYIAARRDIVPLRFPGPEAKQRHLNAIRECIR